MVFDIGSMIYDFFNNNDTEGFRMSKRSRDAIKQKGWGTRPSTTWRTRSGGEKMEKNKYKKAKERKYGHKDGAKCCAKGCGNCGNDYDYNNYYLDGDVYDYPVYNPTFFPIVNPTYWPTYDYYYQFPAINRSNLYLPTPGVGETTIGQVGGINQPIVQTSVQTKISEVDGNTKRDIIQNSRPDEAFNTSGSIGPMTNTVLLIIIIILLLIIGGLVALYLKKN